MNRPLLVCSLALVVTGFRLAAAEAVPRVTRVASAEVEVAGGTQSRQLKPGERVGSWTLMAIVRPGNAARPLAVFEDFSELTGRMVFVDETGVVVDLPKSAEPTFADPAKLYHGHMRDEVLESEHDLLRAELLAGAGDPDYATVAACFEPIRRMSPYTFVGTPACADKIGIDYGGRTPGFDPAIYAPEIRKIRDAGKVLDGLVGGWLPVVRFTFPEDRAGDWTEMLAYAPFRIDNGNDRLQPAWYRVCQVKDHQLAWVRYFDSYHPFPPRTDPPAGAFYGELLEMRAQWQQALSGGMVIDIPDQPLADLARHSLVREMMTRVGAFPKYGVVERNYGGAEHDGFPDTFTVDTAAMIAWGLFNRARDYIDNYLTYFVRDDGSILYRGPETGQYGRMLTVVAEYANDSGDTGLLLKHRQRLDAIAQLLLALRTKALTLPREDPAYGMLVGWNEADACVDPEPLRYMQPYFGNSSEAARGWSDLGRVWERIGRETKQVELERWGTRLQDEARTLTRDLQTSIARSTRTDVAPAWLPAIAGAAEPFHAVAKQDPLHPLFRSYRTYGEMLYSGNLTRGQVEMIVRFRAAHRDTILGIPTAYGYNTHELAGFLSYGHAYGLLHQDMSREFLLLLYSLRAHQFTRGSWTAPETRPLNPLPVAPYCPPAQMVVPLMTRWLLVFEEPLAETLWLARATPRAWLENGKKVAVSAAPTRWGRVDFTLQSQLDRGMIGAELRLPATASFQIKLRIRVPDGHRMDSVQLNGQPWTGFAPQEETVTLPAGTSGTVALVIQYR